MRDVRDEYFRKMYIRACEVANNSTEDPKVREVASAYCEMRSSLVRELKKLDAIEEEKSGLEKRIASLEEAIDEQDREIHRLHIEQEFLSIKQLIEFSDDFEEIMWADLWRVIHQLDGSELGDELSVAQLMDALASLGVPGASEVYLAIIAVNNKTSE